MTGVQGSGAAPWVLLVEDDQSLTKLAVLIFADEGIELRTVNDGRRAVEMVEACRPAVVLLDMRLPAMSGDEVVEAMRALPGGAPPIILLSASADLPETAQRVGAQGYVRKPFDIDLLVAAVRPWLAAARAAPEPSK